MNKRFLYISIFFLIATLSYGQLTFDGWSNKYLGVNSYDGAISNDAFTLRYSYNGTYLNELNWKLSVMLITPFVSDNDKIPANKIKLSPIRTEGQNNFPGPIPTMLQIGMTSGTLIEQTEVFIVPSSNAPLNHMSEYPNYSNLGLVYNLIVEGGNYLQKLQNKTYFGVLRFTAYRGDNSVIGFKDVNYKIQVHGLSGTPPSNEYSISFSTEASNAQIEYNTLADYVNGKSVTYRNGLTVSATTPYQVTVRSVDANFTSISGKTLPLEIISMQLIGKQGAASPTVLSTNRRNVLQGLSTNGLPENYDIRYFTSANDRRLYEVSSDQYSTQLMFEIIPQ